MSNKLYDCLKWISQVLIPGVGTLYFGIANVWHLPYSEEVVGTLTVLDAFLGILLGISTANYNSRLEEVKKMNGQGD